MLIEVMANDSE